LLSLAAAAVPPTPAPMMIILTTILSIIYNIININIKTI
jgi:hypothetical protein